MLLDNGYPIQKALEEIPDSSFKQTLIQKYILRTWYIKLIFNTPNL